MADDKKLFEWFKQSKSDDEFSAKVDFYIVSCKFMDRDADYVDRLFAFWDKSVNQSGGIEKIVATRKGEQ